MELVKVARNAMATRFEIALPGSNPAALRGAADEALDEIERLENQLSLYRSGSEIAELNAHAADRPVRVSPPVFRLLQWAADLSRKTAGAFDITVGPLVRCWGFMKGSGEFPAESALTQARGLVGADLILFDENNFTIQYAKPGVIIDLGSFGKGFALDRAAEILTDAGVENALLHGGTSTVYGLGEHPVEGPWKIAIEKPAPEEGGDPTVVAVVPLQNQALSVSAVWGKSFTHEGKRYGHVIDPRTGYPVEHGLLGAVIIPTAAGSDALSTAVLLANPSDLPALQTTFPAIAYLKLHQTSTGCDLHSHRIEITEQPS